MQHQRCETRRLVIRQRRSIQVQRQRCQTRGFIILQRRSIEVQHQRCEYGGHCHNGRQLDRGCDQESHNGRNDHRWTSGDRASGSLSIETLGSGAQRQCCMVPGQDVPRTGSCRQVVVRNNCESINAWDFGQRFASLDEKIPKGHGSAHWRNRTEGFIASAAHHDVSPAIISILETKPLST